MNPAPRSKLRGILSIKNEKFLNIKEQNDYKKAFYMNSTIKPWIKAELEYADKLRNCSCEERIHLYEEAYSNVSKLKIESLKCKNPENRTAGTSYPLVNTIAKYCNTEDHVLEIGCGRGFTCFKLADHVKSIVGTDVSTYSLEEAKELIKANTIFNVEFIKCNAFGLSQQFPQESFDVVISIDVIEHLHPKDCFEHFKQVYNLLKIGGKYIIQTPNKHNGPHDVTREVFPEAKNAKGFHLNEMSYYEIQQAMQRIGFKQFDSFYVSNKKIFKNIALKFPVKISLFIEKFYDSYKNISLIEKICKKFLGIHLIVEK